MTGMGDVSAASPEVWHLRYHSTWLCRPPALTSANQPPAFRHCPTTYADFHCPLYHWCVPFCSFYLPAMKPHAHTHTRLTALCPGLPRWASTRKVKPIWILLKQETVSSSRIHWTICKSTPRSRQITTPAPHRWVFYRPDALPVAQPTVSKHWRHSWSPIHVSDFSLRC